MVTLNNNPQMELQRQREQMQLEQLQAQTPERSAYRQPYNPYAGGSEMNQRQGTT